MKNTNRPPDNSRPHHNQQMEDQSGEAGIPYAYRQREQDEHTLEDYYALPDERRVELIDGVFYDMAAPTDVQLDCDDRKMLQPDVLVVCDRDKIRECCVFCYEPQNHGDI